MSNEDVTLDLDSRQSPPGDAPAIRDAWGSFKLLARVGHGGFGEVYRAWDPDLEREVALKLLLPSPTGDGQTDEEYKAMLREARALASVRHANIVPVYGIDRHDGRVGFWTDFVKGRTLTSLLGSQGPFGYREAALIGLDVTRALSAVHRAGILHRDIKAENVMREEGGRILLMDFGLSTLPHRQADIAGTPNYMAPELWQGQAASVESDIYAMGVLLFYLVTGEYPAKLGGLSVTEATAALAKRRTLMDLRSDLPEPFLRTVGRAMEIDPARRFTSAGQLAEALAEALGTAVPLEAKPPIASPVAEVRQGLSRWMKWGIAGVFVLGGAGLKLPAVRRVLRLDTNPEKAAVASTTSEASGSHYDDYEKATTLLQKSYKDSNVTDAIHLFESIPKDDPAFKLAEAGLGAAYFKQYRNSGEPALLDKATAASKAALALDSKLAPALVTMAQIEANAGHNEVAMAQIEDAIRADPNSAEAYAAEGEVYVALGRMPDAIAAIQKSIALEPDNSMWLLRLGDDYKSIGRLDDAKATWTQAAKLDPQNTFAYYDLGVVNMRLDKLDEARQDLQKVLAAGPDEDSYRALGTVYKLQGDYGNAETTDKQAIRLDPNDYQAWLNLGNVYAWSGHKHEQALAAYAKAINLAENRAKTSPASADLLIELANLYASVGNAEKSLPLINKALALARDDSTVAYLAGYAYELLGRRGEAIPLIASALAQEKLNPEFQHSPELASLRSDPAFLTALRRAKASSR